MILFRPCSGSIRRVCQHERRRFFAFQSWSAKGWSLDPSRFRTLPALRSVSAVGSAFERRPESAPKISHSDSKLPLERAIFLERPKELVCPQFRVPAACWLFSSAFLCFGMIVIGGYTRLSGAGLSMTDWRFAGERWPGSDEAWCEEFKRYQLTPEYKAVHLGLMDVEGFKRIFFVEWFHRMWGRGTLNLFSWNASTECKDEVH